MINHYVADITNVSDYYPFGSPLYGRRWSAGYRYGFNGKENDDEIIGKGRWQDYGVRMYRTDLGRFFSPDPLIVFQKKYPELSSYQFASLNPIQNIDIDGLEGADPKFENANSIYFVGGQGMSKEDKAIYNEAFNNIVVAGATGIISEFAIGGLINWGAKIYRAYKVERSVQKVATAEKIVQNSAQGIEKTKSAFQAAKEGGKHSGLLKNYASKSIKEIEKAVQSLDKKAQEHLDYIKDPAKALLDKQKRTGSGKLWKDMTKKEQEGILKFWKKEADTYKEQKEVLEGLIKEKSTK
ncbi:MAG: RHS repeat-associated core domain-containing protein [Bacteroidota bacterium]